MKGEYMARIVSVCALIIISASLRAGETKILTLFEAQHDLFSVRAELTGVEFPMQDFVAKKKSPAIAAIYSLLLPGLGEHYADGWSGTGKYFSGLEGLLWLGYAGADIYGNSLKNDSRSFAAAHAGVNPSLKDDNFYVDVGNFINTQEFNDKRLREREAERLYDVNAGSAWQWDSDVNRALYKERRIASEDMLNNRKFIVTAIIINHVASAINAARTAISHNKNLNDQIGQLQFKADVMGGLANPHGVMLTILKTF